MRLTLEHIETDPAQLVDIRMVDLGQKPDLGGRHRVIIGKEQLELEDAALGSCQMAIDQIWMGKG